VERRKKEQRLEACRRGSEATVISAAAVWELETLAHTIARTPREERKEISSFFFFPL
jgi:hypothetical protein